MFLAEDEITTYLCGYHSVQWSKDTSQLCFLPNVNTNKITRRCQLICKQKPSFDKKKPMIIVRGHYILWEQGSKKTERSVWLNIWHSRTRNHANIWNQIEAIVFIICRNFHRMPVLVLEKILAKLSIIKKSPSIILRSIWKTGDIAWGYPLFHDPSRMRGDK